jgi:hypothetical protein
MVGQVDAAMQQGVGGGKQPTAKANTSQNAATEDPLRAGDDPSPQMCTCLQLSLG